MTRLRRLGLVLAGPSIVMAAPFAWAHQAQTGSLLRDPAAAVPERKLSPKDRAWEVMNRFGVCVVRTRPAAVKRALAQPENAVEAALAKLASDDCLQTGELHMSRTLFRGAVYRALYLRDFGGMTPAALTALSAARGQADAAPSFLFSACVAKLSPDGARALVIANAGTRDAGDAIAQLRPALADCLPPKQQVHLTPWGLQASLSEALYKRTVALADVPNALGGK